ncbi:MAG: hypothetical protein RLZ74_1016 [Actinomycetota bacterium]
MPTRDTSTTFGDVVDLVRAYVRQQTVTPLRGVGRWVAFGLFGGILLVIGLVFLAMGALRGMQGIAAFEGGLSFVPYFVVLVGSIVLIGITKGRISIGTLHPGDTSR